MMRKNILIIKDNIINMATDAIVNAANNSLLGGGGVDGAIHRKAGKELLEECKTLNGCQTGQAKITKGYNLKAKWVIHTVGPIWGNGIYNEDELLRSCYKNSLLLAEKNKLHSIAFPSISTGAYRFPVRRASRIAFTEIKSTLNDLNYLNKVFIVLFDEKTFNIYNEEYKNILQGSESYE
jgi:O-acetyl-ADP-ribose deacetylase (regulator of RNase III)